MGGMRPQGFGRLAAANLLPPVHCVLAASLRPGHHVRGRLFTINRLGMEITLRGDRVACNISASIAKLKVCVGQGSQAVLGPARHRANRLRKDLRRDHEMGKEA
jgi:hypothetical protein